MATIQFDLDGTLTDPYPGIARCMQHTLGHFGLVQESEEVLRSYIGPPIEDNFAHAGIPAERFAQALAIFDAEYAAGGMLENSVYEGIRELLAALKQKGHVLAIASSKAKGHIQRIIHYFGLEEYFGALGGANPDGSGAEKAEVIGRALGELGIAPHGNVYLVGDRDFDVIGARKAGIKCIAVLYGYGSKAELAAQSPDHLAATVEELAELLLSLPV